MNDLEAFQEISSDEFLKRAGEKRKNKYGNKKVILDGIKFDSKKEARRYKELKFMEENGIIKDLELQPKYELTPTIRHNGKTLPKMSYIRDFRYKDKEGQTIVEDTKGKRTSTYIAKLKMFLFKYGDKLTFKES